MIREQMCCEEVGEGAAREERLVPLPSRAVLRVDQREEGRVKLKLAKEESEALLSRVRMMLGSGFELALSDQCIGSRRGRWQCWSGDCRLKHSIVRTLQR